MKRKNTMKKTALMLAIVLCISSFAATSHAATGYQGYVIYRDGVGSAGVEFDWHAGIMNLPYNTSLTFPVIHIGGYGMSVTYCTWDSYMEGNEFMGVYEPTRVTMTSAKLDNVLSKARALCTDDIGYTIFLQIDHGVTNPDSRVNTSNISLMRCDGVVEYCYEWYGYRIYGSELYWNITYGGIERLNHHSYNFISPDEQASDYMDIYHDGLPRQ